MADVFFVYVTASDDAEARTIARAVVEERLAACANLLGGIESVYWWNGELCEGAETALILKTTQAQKEPLIERIKQLHAYETPCVVCLPMDGGNPDFLSWIASETTG